MEYLFGKTTRRFKPQLVLRTKGDRHTDLYGSFSISKDYPDCTITQSCVIVDHYKSAEDSEGNFYDWYKIEQYDCKIDLAETERTNLNTEIDELTAYCGDVVEQIYEADLEYVIG